MRFEALLSQIFILLYAVVLSNGKSQALSDFLSNEDDEILNEIIPVKIKRNNVHGNTRRRSTGPFPQDPQSNTAKVSSQQKEKDMTSSILGDVNKYGLWEYTADNTGMGDQLKKLMNSDQGNDANSVKTSHSLEKQASKMNEQINKYVESNIDSSSPTIDPLETPEGYTPTQRPLAFKGVDSNAEVHNANLDVVTIPNSIQIEDEHGNLLDTVKPEKPVSRNHPTSKPIISAYDPTQSVRHAVHPTAKTISQVSPTLSLTERLLKALKSSPSFRMNAQKLLASDTDTDEEVKIKQSKLSAYLTEYEQNLSGKQKLDNAVISNSLTKLKENGQNTDQKGRTEGKNDGKLLTMIKHLMKDENSINTNQIQSLLSSLKKSDNKSDKQNDDIMPNDNKESSKFSKENSKHGHAIKSMNKQANSLPQRSTDLEKATDKELDAMDDINIEPQHHAAKTNKKDDPVPSLHHKDTMLSEYTSPADDLDHPLGNDAQESPLMGYLEQESAALSNIKVDNINPDMEKIQQIMRNHEEEPDGKKEQENMIYEQLKKLLKSPHKENPFSPEKIKALGKQIENTEVESSKLKDDSGEEDDTNLMLMSLRKHSNSSNDLLSEFRKFLKIYHGNGKQSANDVVGSSSAEAVQSSSSVESHDTGALQQTTSIEDELKEIQKQKELLKNREEKLKELSQQKDQLKIAKQNSARIKQVDDPVDHMLELATPQLKNKSVSLEDLPSIPAPGKSIYPSNDIHPELQHTVTSGPDNSVSVTSQFKQPVMDPTYGAGQSDDTDLLNAADIQPEDIKRLKQVIGNSLKTHLLGDVLHKSKVMSFKTPGTHTSNDVADQRTDKKQEEETSTVETSKVKTHDSKEDIKIDSSIKAALNKAGISDKEIDSKFNAADTSHDVDDMIKELSKNSTVNTKHKNLSENETKSDTDIINPANKTLTRENITSSDNITITNTTGLIANKTGKPVTDDQPGLPINNPKPNADEGYAPHANFHTTFRSRPSQEGSHKNSALPQHSLRQAKPLQSHVPHFSQQNLLTQYRNVAPSMRIRHFHRKPPSLMNAQNALLPPAGMGRPKIKSAYGHVTDIMEPVEPPLISYKTSASHHSNINKLQPLFKSMPTMFHAFLKHKIMPAIDEFSITGNKKSLNFENKSPVSENAFARIIKPQSAYNNHFIDVAASKKSFGKLPNKPKSYLIKELRHKLKILTLKRHLEKQLLKKFRHRLKNLNEVDRENTTAINDTMTLDNKTTKISKNVLIPESSAITSGTLIRQDSNVIVPGSRYTNHYSSVLDENRKEKNVSENDVTRSQLPKAKNESIAKKEHGASIEEVFNIIGSEDQINERNLIPTYKRSKVFSRYKKLHSNYGR